MAQEARLLGIYILPGQRAAVAGSVLLPGKMIHEAVKYRLLYRFMMPGAKPKCFLKARVK